jgi:hypothetical protein
MNAPMLPGARTAVAGDEPYKLTALYRSSICINAWAVPHYSHVGQMKLWSRLAAKGVRQDLYQWPVVIRVNKNYLHRNVSFAISLLMSHECGCARCPALPIPISSSASFG